jgi:hypothetical protein
MKELGTGGYGMLCEWWRHRSLELPLGWHPDLFNRWPSDRESLSDGMWNTQISARNDPDTVTMPLREDGTLPVRNLGFPGLRDFAKSVLSYSRNSYRYRICHIYETVKLNQIEHKFNYSESEKRFKAFIEHGLVWTLIATIIFFMTTG